MKHDAMLAIRADVVRRIDAIAEQRGHMPLAAMCEEVDGIRHVARSYGLEPLERLASMLESALALDGHGPVVLSYLDMMRDAAACEDVGPHVSTAYLAAMSLRMGA
ncbi:hypothetical protein [Sphingobium algorifonticola]|uniref:Uncharacterized protein n=1 Tax=Sphingobium algorifonticola TaxID=2008318 RepID=A0A437JDT4_9SPHN|nr:hypothetical protein [Sphingobium algorifonticola]RVT43903.1 hypothetical protein ENE74_04785 [Sphingobium algorifonticola]